MSDEMEKLKKQNRQLKRKLKALKPPPSQPALSTSRKALEEAAIHAEAIKPQTPKPEPLPVTVPATKKKGNWLFGAKKEQAPPAPTLTSAVPRVKKIGGRRMWLFWPGLAVLSLAIIIFVVYMKEPSNQFLGLVFVFVAAAGGTMTWFGLKKREEGVKFIDPKKPDEKPLKGLANCLNIYYRKDKKGKVECDRIVFEKMPDDELAKMREEGRLGKYQRFRNDGNYYFVHEQSPDDNLLYPFRLPDTVYYSPRELINVVTMPASHKYAKPKATMMDKLKPAMLLIGIAIVAFLMVITSAPPAPEDNNPAAARSVLK
jgi:hypothetical protein